MKTPYFSIIIPVLSTNKFLLEENLPAHDGMTNKDFEVIVLPNEKSPQDVRLTKKYRWLRIIPTKQITRPAQKRDIGVKKSRGNIIAFIDDDAYPSRNWLSRAKSLFEKNRIEGVCGPGILPTGTTRWEIVFDEILKTWLGSGEYRYRFIKLKGRYVDDYPSMNFFVKKDIFEKAGGFNSDYWPGEDSKLCEDIVYRLGGKIWYDPGVVIYHHRRNTLDSFLMQHGQYGYHRGAFFAHGDHNSRRIVYLVPTFFVAYLILLLAINLIFRFQFSNFGFILLLPLFIYFFLLLIVSFSAIKNTKNLKIAILSAIVLFSMHLVYGVKFAHGLIVGLTKKEKIY